MNSSLYVPEIGWPLQPDKNMKRAVQHLKKRRKFTDSFKKQVVKEYESGKFSVSELSRLYGVANQNIYEWIYKYSMFNKKGYRIVEDHQSAAKKVKHLEQRIKELEAMLGRKQIKLEFLEKMIDLASEELQVDIKKNYSSRRSNGLDVTEDKWVTRWISYMK